MRKTDIAFKRSRNRVKYARLPGDADTAIGQLTDDIAVKVQCMFSLQPHSLAAYCRSYPFGNLNGNNPFIKNDGQVPIEQLIKCLDYRDPVIQK